MFDKRIDLFSLSESENRKETLLIYPSINTTEDPYEGTTTDNFLNPIPIKAIVNQLGMSALKWKYWGNLPTGSIEILTESKNYNLLLVAAKIQYKGNNYYVYKDDAKRFSIIQRTDYLMAILERKQND